jgi:RNA polymerase sigma-70 factor (ECF subfamily)
VADEEGAECDSLSRARSGDAAAFSALVRRHQDRVYSLALRMVWDRHAAEDLAQEVFMQLHRRLSRVQSDAHLVFWLRQVTLRLAIDRLRREATHRVVPLEEGLEVAAELSESDPLLQRRLRTLVAQLPAAARAVVVLRYQEDLDPLDIAATLDMPINTVKSHLRRSLEELRAQLAAHAHDG